MELFEHIRRDRRDEGVSIRGLADRHRVHRRTVRQALRSALPPPRKQASRAAPKLGPYVEIIREWLVADLSAPRKQRHTARRVWERLVDEYGATVAEATVRAYAGRVRRELESGRSVVTIPQLHPPGEGGGGRLRRSQRLARRRADRAVDVRAAALALGAGGPRVLPGRGPGGVPRGPHARPRAPRRGRRGASATTI